MVSDDKFESENSQFLCQMCSTIEALWIPMRGNWLVSQTLDVWVSDHATSSYLPRTTVMIDRGWDGWMASPTQWAWVWVNSGRWWWTGRPGVLRFMGSQESDMTERLNWTEQLWWRRKWLPTPVFLPGGSYGQRSLSGYSPRGRKESDVTKYLSRKLWRHKHYSKEMCILRSKGPCLITAGRNNKGLSQPKAFVLQT